MPSAWITHVKKVQKDKGISYKEALKVASRSYKKAPKKSKNQRGGNPALASDVYKPRPARGADGYTALEGTKKSQVYKKGDKVIVALRGTADAKDVGSDALIATGTLRLGNRYKGDKAFTQKAIKKYGKGNVSVVGHSLGGTLAKRIGKDLNIPSKGYNSGGGPVQAVGGTIDRIACKVNPNGKRCKKAKQHTTVRVASDPISLLAAPGVNTKLVKRKAGENPHTISNFT